MERLIERLEERRLFATFYVDASIGNDSFDGSQTTVSGSKGPFKTIQRAITAVNNTPNTADTVQIAAGVYREQPNIVTATSGSSSANRTVITAAPSGAGYAAVYILGSDIITGTWTRDGTSSRYYISGANFASGTSQVFYNWSTTNDVPSLKQIGAVGNESSRTITGSGVSDMTAGSFYCDTANSRLYIWLPDSANPNTGGRVISYAKRARAIYQPGTSGGSGYTYAQYLDIKGIKLRHNNAYDTVGQDINCGLYTANDQRLIDVDIEQMSGTGVILRGSSQMINCTSSYNGGNGVAGQGVGFLISGGQYNYNYWRRYQTGSDAGIKVITNTPDIFGNVVNAEIANNIGHGLWYDTCFQNASSQLINGNYIHDNTGSGIFLEASRNFVVTNNVVTGNGDSGIQLNATENAKIYNNTIVGNYGRAAVELNAGTRDQGMAYPGTVTATGMINNAIRNNIIANNYTVYDLDVPTQYVGAYRYNNTSDYNLFYRRGESLKFTTGGTYVGWGTTPSTLAGWRTASGQDQNSRVADPLFLTGGAGALAMKLGSDSPAKDTGLSAASVLSNDYSGAARPSGTGFDIGAFEYVSGGTGTAGSIVVNTDPTVWVDDQLPSNAAMTQPDATGNTGSNRFWYWTGSNAFSGVMALDSGVVAGRHRQYFTNADARAIGSSDILFAYVYIDPANVPQQIELEYLDAGGSWSHRAYWGVNQLIDGLEGTASQRYLGALPAAGQWARLEVPAASVGLAGVSITGFSFTLLGGRALLDKVGNVAGSTAFGTMPTLAASGSTTIQAEDFDNGALGVAYNDSTTNVSSAVYRTTAVDLAATADTGGGFAVVSTTAGEWLKYTINAPFTSQFTLTARVASASAGNTMRVLLDERDITGALSVPNTGGTDTYTSVTATGIAIGAGQHTLRVLFDTGNVSLNYLTLTNTSVDGVSLGQRGFATATQTGLLRVEAEDYNDGANGQAYYDTTAGNAGGSYRGGDGDIYTVSGGGNDQGSKFYVGGTAAGEWLKYTISAATTGQYGAVFRVASPSSGSQFRLLVDGVDVSGALTVPNTGAWETFTEVATPGFTLSAGAHVLQVQEITGGFNINYFLIGGSAAPAAPSGLAATVYSSTLVSLTWNDNAATEWGQALEWSSDGVNYSTLATLQPGVTTYLDTRAAASSFNYYRVRALGTPNSSVSNVVSTVTAGMISASVFGDVNSNGVQDGGEVGLPGQSVYLDQNGNGALDAGETTGTTTASGTVQFFGLLPGTYSVRVVVPTGGTQTAPAGGAASLTLNYGAQGSATFGLVLRSATPSAPVLSVASDTGVQGDGITRLNNSTPASVLSFTVGNTVAGSQVQLFAGGVLVGTATAAGSTTVVTTAGNSTLADGARLFSAVQVEVGKLASNSSAPTGVTIDSAPVAAPTITIESGAAQRSMVRSVRVVFGKAVTLNSGLVLSQVGNLNGLPAGVAVSVSNPAGDGKQYVLSFSGTAVIAGSLPDGVYDLTALTGNIQDVAGNTLASNSALRFHRLFGDIDGNRTVDSADMSQFNLAYARSAGSPQYNSAFDFDGNGAINNTDLLQLRRRLGVTLFY
jgi:parallel beta-helix repeat protein